MAQRQGFNPSTERKEEMIKKGGFESGMGIDSITISRRLVLAVIIQAIKDAKARPNQIKTPCARKRSKIDKRDAERFLFEKPFLEEFLEKWQLRHEFNIDMLRDKINNLRRKKEDIELDNLINYMG